MFDKTVENRSGFVNDKYNSTPCHSDRREESININRTPMFYNKTFGFDSSAFFITFTISPYYSSNL